jgi:hypothetical protein
MLRKRSLGSTALLSVITAGYVGNGCDSVSGSPAGRAKKRCDRKNRTSHTTAAKASVGSGEGTGEARLYHRKTKRYLANKESVIE